MVLGLNADGIDAADILSEPFSDFTNNFIQSFAAGHLELEFHHTVSELLHNKDNIRMGFAVLH